MENEEFRDLQERSALIEEMAQTPGWELLQDRAKVTLFKRQQRLILGRAEDFEDYKTECAWMDGVSWLLELPMTVKAELDLEVARRKEVTDEEEAEDD